MGRCLTGLMGMWFGLGLAGPGHASAWNPAQWRGEVITTQVFLSADQVTNEFGVTSQFDDYRKSMTQNFAMLGLTSDLALIGAFDWQNTDILGAGTDISFSKPSTVAVGLQYQLRRREGHAVAVSVQYYDGIDLPPELLTIDAREPTIEFRALWGESRPWRKHSVFAELQVASRVTLDGDYANASSQLTVGGQATDRIQLISKLRYTDVAAGQWQGFPLAAQSRLEAETSIVYRIRRRDYIELGLVETLAGRNWVDEGGVKIGFWTKF